MTEIFDTLLLLALPASGKSEVRTFLDARDPAEFHMGPTVQLDDYPYVHLQLRVDEILSELGLPRVYHNVSDGARNGPFQDARELGGLGRLLAEDYDELLAGRAERPEHPARRLLTRFDDASAAAGAARKFDSLPREALEELIARLQDEARAFFEEKAAACPESLEGKTVVIEFARGAPEGATMPAPPGFGYAGTLPYLSARLLQRAAILYVWVSPEESRRKNRERARPGGDGSILFHGVPEDVMRMEYGSCDMAHLIETSKVPGTVTVESDGRTLHVPVGRFDNREDLTSFLRDDPGSWSTHDVDRIRGALGATCDDLFDRFADLRF